MLTILQGVFAGKTVLVTGHTGFKGSWLDLWLWRLGARVTGYSLEPPTDPSNFVDSDIAEILSNHHLADVRDTDSLARTLHDCEPDLVIHLAAQSVVRQGYQEPLETFSTNVMGTASVLEAIRRVGRPVSVVMVTSDKCYENMEHVWGYRESDALGEHDPYGGSKGAAELVIRAYRDSYFPVDRISEHGIKVASARAGNVLGGGDWTSNALIVDVVNSLTNRKPIQVRNPRALRPWQHVLQALSGYLTLGAKLMTTNDPSYCSAWNIGPLPGNEIAVSDVVDLFVTEWGEGHWVDAGDPTAPREAGILRLSIDKAIWKLNWKPAWDVRKTVRETARWYRHHQSTLSAQGQCDHQQPETGLSMQEFSVQQIIAYQDAMREMIC